jgi:hypothetical protein
MFVKLRSRHTSHVRAVGTIITLQHGGPYTLMLGTWALHLPVIALTLAKVKQWKPVSSFASLQSEQTSWGTDVFTVLSLLSAVILLFAPAKGMQMVEKFVLNEDMSKTSTKIGVLARSAGALELELAIFNALHGRSHQTTMFAVRSIIAVLCGLAVMWHWGFFMPHLNLPKTAGALASALIVAGPSLLSLPASFAEQFLLASGNKGVGEFHRATHRKEQVRSTSGARSGDKEVHVS